MSRSSEAKFGMKTRKKRRANNYSDGKKIEKILNFRKTEDVCGACKENVPQCLQKTLSSLHIFSKAIHGHGLLWVVI